MSKFIRWTLAALCAAMLAGCAAQGGDARQALQGAVNGLGKMLGAPPPGQAGGQGPAAGGDLIGIDNVPIRIGGARPADPRWAGTPLRESKLMGLFVGKPSGDCHPCYPRVAIVVTDYSETLLTKGSALNWPGNPNPPPPRPDECVKFDATLWTDAKHSELLRNILLCNADIQKADKVYSRTNMQDFDASFGRPPHTYEVRTTGPKAPYRLLALDTKADSALWANGFYLFGNLFVLTGYQGGRQMAGVMEDRMWFVNVAEKPH